MSGFHIYCRTGSHAGRFRPLGRTGLVVNLVHALRFETREKAEGACGAMRDANPDWTFEARCSQCRRVTCACATVGKLEPEVRP